MRGSWKEPPRASRAFATDQRAHVPHSPRGYVAARPGPDGFVRSVVLDHEVRIVQTPARMGLSRYSLEGRASRSRRQGSLPATRD